MRQPSRKFVQAAVYGLAAILLTLVSTSFIRAQTFRGGINGTVEDHTGAAIAKAEVVAVDTETGGSHTTTSSSAGEFLFQAFPSAPTPSPPHSPDSIPSRRTRSSSPRALPLRLPSS